MHDDTPVLSPFATTEQRNRLVRKPLRNCHDEIPIMSQLSASQTRRRSGRTSYNSPPNEQYTTSSPLEFESSGGGGSYKVSSGSGRVGRMRKLNRSADQDGDISTPGLSIIRPMNGESRDPSPRKGDTKHRRFLLNTDDDGNISDELCKHSPSSKDSEEQTSEDTSSEDDIQPSPVIRKGVNKRNVRDRSGRFRTSRDVSRERIIAIEVEKKRCSFLFLLEVLISTLLILMGGVFFFEKSLVGQTQPDEQFNLLDMKNAFTKNINKLKTNFPGQESDTFLSVRANLRRIIQKEVPNQPSVLILTHDVMNENAALCFGLEIVNAVNLIFGRDVKASRLLHQAKEFKEQNQLFDVLNASLNQSAAVMISNVQQLPGKAALALHAFCDNINAPYKRALIVMTVPLEKQMIRKDNLDGEIENVLTKRWSRQLEEDKLAPILSRVVVSVARVAQEKKLPCV